MKYKEQLTQEDQKDVGNGGCRIYRMSYMPAKGKI